MLVLRTTKAMDNKQLMFKEYHQGNLDKEIGVMKANSNNNLMEMIKAIEINKDLF